MSQRIFFLRLAAFLCCALSLADCSTTKPPTNVVKSSGLFRVYFDSNTGKVTKVQIVKSTGVSMLDATTVKTFLRWRCKPHALTAVTVPVTYTLTRPTPTPTPATR